MTKTGHSFIKARMRQEDAVYGGELSAHHYFKDFAYCDSGMIPWLLVCSLLSRINKPLSQLVAGYQAAYPVSGEINTSVHNPDAIIQKIAEKYHNGNINYTDGLSISFPEYRFNIRKSNTEPLLRLNVESRGDRALMEEKTKELLAIINLSE
jgi:phosphomannomutase